MTTDDTDDDSDALTFAEMMDFVEEEVKEEKSNFSGEVPNHAAKLLVARSSEILTNMASIDMQNANEEKEDVGDDAFRGALEEGVVEVLLTVGALKHEYNLDIEEAFEERIQHVRDFKEFEEAMEEADGQEDVMEAFDEHMGEHAEESPFVEPGDNVDSDEYDADDDRDRHFA